VSGLGAYLWERRAEIAAHTGEHLVLVVLSTLAAVAIGIPLGVALTRRPRLARPVLGLAGVVQTIPSLALFGFLIPLPFLGGIGPRTAIVALVLYALLPILRNTYSGIRSVDPAVVESATGLGLTARQRPVAALTSRKRSVSMSKIHIGTGQLCSTSRSDVSAGPARAGPVTVMYGRMSPETGAREDPSWAKAIRSRRPYALLSTARRESCELP